MSLILFYCNLLKTHNILYHCSDDVDAVDGRWQGVTISASKESKKQSGLHGATWYQAADDQDSH